MRERGSVYPKCAYQVDEDGFFFCETGLDGAENYEVYEEGRNADGEVLYTMWDGDWAESQRSGSFTPEGKVVSEPLSLCQLQNRL